MALATSSVCRNFLHSWCMRCVRLEQRAPLHITSERWAGHSKWANIRHIKAAKDGQRAALFGRLVRQIRMSIQEGGSANPQVNTLLKSTIDDALKRNMPLATIQSTIKRCEQSKEQLRKHLMEIKIVNTPIYLICVLFTDNLPGLRMQMAPVVKKAGGAFVDARHLFDSRGIIETTVVSSRITAEGGAANLEESCTEDAIECGAEEVEIVNETTGEVNFLCDPDDLDRVSRALRERTYTVDTAQHVCVPKTAVSAGEDERKLCDTLREKLKTLEGVDEVYDNIHFEGGTMAAVAQPSTR